MSQMPASTSTSTQRAKISRSLKARHTKERIFRYIMRSSVFIALFCVVFLFGSILVKGMPAFWQSSISTSVYFDPSIIKIPAKPVRGAQESTADFQQRFMAWQSDVALQDWDALLVNGVIAQKPEFAASQEDIAEVFSQASAHKLKTMVLSNPAVMGTRQTLTFLTSADIDVWVAGNIDRNLPDEQQQLSPELRQLVDHMVQAGLIQRQFNWDFFINADSRSYPEQSGLAGAIVGSFFMMLTVMLAAVPVGVASAIYLEEFAPKNRLTDLIEININNLAAVPSIVFGLLGAVVFINVLHLPLSAPLVGGLVLSLMTLPIIIISTRAAIKAVPSSIRQAAMGLGASKVQTTFHHVLPLASTGILTGSIIGVAQALGETAPLLLIGMSAFVANIPATPLDQSTALPVQIFLWQGNELRNFFEPRTAAAILVLLLLMLSLNGLAIWLRRKLEVRW